MKRYTYKLAIAFIISYIILMVVVVFAYTQISQNFIMNQAEDQLTESGEVVSKQIEVQLNFDYERFEVLITDYVANSLDPIVELESNVSTIFINGLTFSHFGLIDVENSNITIDTSVYTFIDNFTQSNFDQNIAFYSYEQAFGRDEKMMYGVFKVDQYIALFELEPYIATFLTSEKIENEYVFMGEENTIYLSSSLNQDSILFYNYLRQSGYSEDHIDEVKEVVINHQSGIFRLNFLDQESILSFVPVFTDLSTRTYYLVQIYEESAVINSLSYLSSTLWALFAVIFVLFSITIIVIYKILEEKIHDIENARLSLYYAKPYIIKVKKSGKIKSYNRAFNKLLGDTDTYQYIQDFIIKGSDEESTMIERLHRQKAFTMILEIMDKAVYIRFIITRSTGGFILVGDDITHIEGKFDEFEKLALFNPVTNLPNQNVLINDLDKVFQDQEILEQFNVLVTFDIVAFTKIGLVLGEESADRFLQFIAELTKESLENYPATLYNIRVDQFAILFTNLESYQWIDTWINLFLNKLDKPITMDRNFLNVDVKLGIFNIESQKYEILTSEICLENAKLALNHAKESSTKPSFVYDVSLSLVASREQRMEIDLANAITNQEFQMALQAQYSNVEERIIGFEALIRWTNPKYSAESPLKFIQMAEKNNMIVDIGKIALHETFLIAKELEPYDVHISINVSPVQMLQAGFVNEVISIFEQYDLKPGSISLEITETFLIDSFELVINKLNIFKRHGFNIHLDDFGTGYSSLQYLRDLPINTIKIDKAFIDDVETDAHSRAIVTMISNLAKQVGLDVIAEGVETEKQNNIVFKAGCNVIQGYMIGPAVPKDKAIQLIEDYNINKTKKVHVIKTKTKEARR
ncbi:MAG: bifunctional diguanylate cyclase/phosphodiesterase [Acholeplasmataceae bacterium]|nr:bifunctional diguanylate cyclase/phosphodiesterase [Acholeplasmataceae bacterium]